MRLRVRHLILVVALVVAGAVSGVAPATAASTTGTDANGVTYSYDPGNPAAGATATGLDRSVFSGATLTIPDTVTFDGDSYPVVSIGQDAFRETSVSSVSLGDSLVTIGPSAFRGTFIATVIIPDSVVTIGGSAFRDAPVESLTLGDSVETIGESAFRGATFASVSIPASVTAIGSYAFDNFYGITITVTFEGVAPSTFHRFEQWKGSLGADAEVRFSCEFADPATHDPAFTTGTWQGYPAKAVDGVWMAYVTGPGAGGGRPFACGATPTPPSLPDGKAWYLDSKETTPYEPAPLYRNIVVYAGRAQAAPTVSYPDTTLSLGLPASVTPAVTGVPTPTFALADGSTLPDGLTLDPSTGVISGTPAAGTVGSHTVTVVASNGVGEAASTSVTLTIALPTETDAKGVIYRFDPTDVAAGASAIGLDPSYTGTALALPSNVKLAGVTYRVTSIGDGAFQGASLTSASIPASVTDIGDNAFSSANGATITVTFAGAAPAQFEARGTNTGSLGQNAEVRFSCAFADPAAHDTVFATTGTWQGYPAEALDQPQVLLDANGFIGMPPPPVVLCGETPQMPAAPDGLGWYVDYQATTLYQPAPLYHDITVYAGIVASPTISYTSPTFTVGVDSTSEATVTGAPTPTVSLAEGSSLPAGLELDPETGAISGSPGPDTAGSHPVGIVVDNGVGDPVTIIVTVTVQQAPAVVGPDSPTFTVGQAGSWMPTVAGFPAPTITAAGLPDGLSIDPTTGEISGVPAIGADGAHPVTVTATNGIGDPVVVTVELTVSPAPPIAFTMHTDRDDYQPGDLVVITGSGLPAGTVVALSLHSTPIPLGTVTAGSDGTFATSVTLPLVMEPGDHSVVASVEVWGTVSTQSSAFTLTQTASDDDQPGVDDGTDTDAPAGNDDTTEPVTGSGTDVTGGTDTTGGNATTGGNVTWGPGLAATGGAPGMLIAAWLAIACLVGGALTLSHRRRH